MAKPPRAHHPGHPEKRVSKQIDFRFRRTDEVGSLAAENDPILDETFVDAGNLAILQSANDRRSIVVGRTGVGKTALLLQLERTAERVQRIDPLSMAIGYIQHTDIPALINAKVNFDPFFRFLWRHVLVLEVLRTWHESKTGRTFGEFILSLERKWGGKQLREVLQHFEEWCGPGWSEANSRTREVIDKFQGQLKGSLLKGYLGDVSLTIGAEQTDKKAGVERKQFSEEQLSTVQRVVQTVTTQRTKTILSFLEGKVLTDPLKPHYIVIDHLDTQWVDSAFAYDLIEALLDVVGEFAEIDNVKVVVALREDIVAAVRAREQGKRQQWEKYENLFLRIRWAPNALVELIDRRLKRLLKDRYGGPVSLESLLPQTQKWNQTATKYLLDRTLLRPRDLIEFVNLCIQATADEGKHSVGWHQIVEAELLYSQGRLEALENEWSAVWPGLKVVFNAFRDLRQPFTIQELSKSDRLAHVLDAGERYAQQSQSAPVPLPRELYDRMGENYSEMWMLVVNVLYRIGFLGVKPHPQEPFGYATDASHRIDIQITPATALMVHPMFCRALGINLNSIPAIPEHG